VGSPIAEQGGMLALCENLPRSFELALVSSVLDISVR
jgi:hypothetical protein